MPECYEDKCHEEMLYIKCALSSSTEQQADKADWLNVN